MDQNIFSRKQETIDITSGVKRLCLDLGYVPLCEMPLRNGRRADICALSNKGQIMIIEVKSCAADFVVDNKWYEYRDYCDEFYFAFGQNFPQTLLPNETGHIIADGFGAQILKPAPHLKLAAGRRKSQILNFARIAGTKALERSAFS